MAKTKLKRPKNMPMPKAALGTALSTIGAVGSVLGDVFGQDERERMMRERDMERTRLIQANELEGDMASADAFNRNLPKGSTSFYRANGGTIGGGGGGTNPKKKSNDTAAARNRARRKAYLEKAYSMGLDTTNVVNARSMARDVGRLQEVGASTRPRRRGQVRGEVVGHFPTTKGGVMRIPRSSSTYRFLDRGYEIESDTEKAYGGMMKKKMAKGGKMGMTSYNSMTVGSHPTRYDYGGNFMTLQKGGITPAGGYRKNMINTEYGMAYGGKMMPYEMGGKMMMPYALDGGYVGNSTMYEMAEPINMPMRKKAKGGMVAPMYRTKGGKLKPLSSDMQLAEGNKHYESKIDNTSGIKLYGKGGEAVAEIEGGETVKNGTMVYSDRTKVDKNNTYADKAAKLARKKATLEVEMQDKDAIGRATDKLKIEDLDDQENLLFAHQEMRKGKKGAYGGMMAKGGKMMLMGDNDFLLNKKGKMSLGNSYNHPKIMMARGGTVVHKYNPTPHGRSNRFSPYPVNTGNRALNDYLAYQSPASSLLEMNTLNNPVPNEVDKIMKIRKATMNRFAKGGVMGRDSERLIYDTTRTPSFGGLYKAKGGILKMQEGGGFNFTEDVVPFLDNIVNLGLTADSPKVREPRLQRVKNLETRVNIDPQLSAVNEAVASNIEDITRSVPNANISRSAIARQRLKGAQQKGAILSAKDNRERDLRNRNLLNRQGITSANLDKLGRYDAAQFARDNDIQSRISQNIANLSSDFIDRENRRRAEALDRETLAIIKEGFDPGIVSRTDTRLGRRLRDLNFKR